MSYFKSVLCVTLLSAAIAPSAFGQSTEQPPEDSFRQGETEVGFLTSVGYAMDLWRGLPDSEFLSLGLRLSHVVTGPIAGGPIRGNLLLSAELTPALLFHENHGTTYAFGAEGFLRYYFTPGGRIRPFISAGGGILLSAEPIPRDISNLNFTPQGGGGLAFTLRPGTVFSVEYRIHHMSDGVLTEYNPGVNSSKILIGLSRVR